MIDLVTAQATVFSDISPTDDECVPVLDSLGRVITRNVNALHDLPGSDNSAMDGYAVKFHDLADASLEDPVKLTVVGEVRAGHPISKTLNHSEAIRIMTGGIVPVGGDAVIKDEDTERDGRFVLCRGPVPQGAHIRFRGENARAGQIVLKAGELIGPSEIGLLTALGHTRVWVYRKANVAIISTGDELVDLSEPLTLGKIFSSNSYALAASVLECGGVPLRLPTAEDNEESLTGRLNECENSDVIITSGGVSVGKYDLVKKTLEKFGVEIKFWKVAIKPGKPVLFGKLGHKAIFGLPGNPGAAMITFEQFVRPALLKLMGHRKIFRPRIEAAIDRQIQNHSDRVQFLRCKLHDESGHYTAEVLTNQSPGIVRSTASSDGLIVLPPHFGAAQPGQTVSVQVLS